MDSNIVIIILNWNGWKDTIECLESLYQIDYPYYEVIIVDNGSENDSIKKIKEYCKGNIKINSDFIKYDSSNKPISILEYDRDSYNNKKGEEEEFDKLKSNEKLILIKSEKNYGFPEGCNIGMRYALNKGTEYILLLNNDTVVDKAFLDELLDVAETDPNIGIVGSKILYYAIPNRLQAAGGKINWWAGRISTYGFNEYDKGQYDQIAERDYVYGTSFLMKKEVVDKISFMDPSFFFGVEEYDYCTKAIKAGFKIIYAPESKVWHKVGASSSNLSDYPEILKVVKISGGSKNYKHYYRLFKRHGPKLFIIPFLNMMLIQTIMPFYGYLIKLKKI